MFVTCAQGYILAQASPSTSIVVTGRKMGEAIRLGLIAALVPFFRRPGD
jgi:hypothetical protein